MRPKSRLPLIFLLALTCGVSAVVEADDTRSGVAVPRVGLSSERALGLPSVRANVPLDRYHRYAPYRTGRRWSDYYRRYQAYRGQQDYHWYPWEPLPQTERYKAHYPPVYAVPKLGFQYQYRQENDIGLTLPAETDEPLLPAMTAEPADAVSLGFTEARALIYEKNYNTAGRILADEARYQPDNIHVYVALAEVLVAKGKFSAAAKVLRYGIDNVPDLGPLASENITHHFASPEEFGKHLGNLEAYFRTAPTSREIALLTHTFGLLSGDASAMNRLEELVGDEGVARSAKRLYMESLDALFVPEEAKSEGEAK